MRRSRFTARRCAALLSRRERIDGGRQGLAEGEVHVHRPRDPVEHAGREGRGIGRVIRAVDGRRHVGARHEVAEDPRLPRGLVGPDAAQLLGPVGREEHEGDARMRGLERGGVQLGHGGARGRDHGDREAGLDGEPESQEPRGPLVDFIPGDRGH